MPLPKYPRRAKPPFPLHATGKNLIRPPFEGLWKAQTLAYGRSSLVASSALKGTFNVTTRPLYVTHVTGDEPLEGSGRGGRVSGSVYCHLGRTERPGWGMREPGLPGPPGPGQEMWKLPFQIHYLLEHLVRCSYHPGVRLEGLLGFYHLYKLCCQIHIGELEGVRVYLT